MGRPVILYNHERCLECAHSTVEADKPAFVACRCGARKPHVDLPDDCARDEITEWVASFYAGDDLPGAVQWLLGWANRRAEQVHGRLAESLRNVAGAELATVTWPMQATVPANVIRELREQVEMDEQTIRALQVDASQALRWSGLPLPEGAGGE